MIILPTSNIHSTVKEWSTHPKTNNLEFHIKLKTYKLKI
jgi:hypothetical protein